MKTVHLANLIVNVFGAGTLVTAPLIAQQGEPVGIAAFRTVTSVFMSPRCVNCHIPGDGPLQGDDGRPHVMQIKRGADGRGTPAVKCSTCHQTRNVAALHGPPGADGWRLPPRNTPMAWHGLPPATLCRNLKNPSMTGGRSLAQLIDHVSDDHLVRWAWDPGLGRSIPSVTHEVFTAAFKAWVQDGAPCPES